MAAPNIALLISSFSLGGVQRIMVNMANELTKRGFSVALVAVSGKGPLRAKVSPQVTIRDLKSSRVLFGISRLVRFFKVERPAVFISGQTHLNAISSIANKISGGPSYLIVVEHNHMSSVIKSESKWVDRLRPLWARVFYPWANEILAVSEEVAADLSRLSGIDRERIKVVYNPIIDPNVLQEKDLVVDHPWFEDSKIPVVIGVGRLSAQKGFANLIQAMAKVDKVNTARLVILGEGEERANLERLAHDLGLGGKVWMPGYVENPFAYIKRADLFVLSSFWEGLPSVLVEAMACGTSVLSTNCPAGPRGILEDGKVGKLIPVGDVDAMADGILYCLSHPQEPEALINQARRFLSSTAVQGYIDLFPQFDLPRA